MTWQNWLIWSVRVSAYALVILVALVIVLFFALSYPTQVSCEDAYALVAEGAVPDSFQLVRFENHSAGIDNCLWMEFMIGQSMLEAVIDNEGYVRLTPGEEWDGLEPPPWWDHRTLGKEATYYESKFYHRGVLAEVRGMWVDCSKSHVFFVLATF